jgi:hypothetical protein
VTSVPGCPWRQRHFPFRPVATPARYSPGLALAGSDRKRAHTLAKRFPAYRRARGVTRERLTFYSFRKCFVRALELAGVDRDRAALAVGHERVHVPGLQSRGP